MTLGKNVAIYRCWLWCLAKGVPMDTTKPFLGPNSFSKLDEKKELISLIDLSELSGCPIELIKNELQLEGDEISMEELRKKMLALLDSTIENPN
jgi:hypothetical protein